MDEEPIKPLLFRYSPMIDDLSNKLGKKINYKIKGESVTFKCGEIEYDSQGVNVERIYERALTLGVVDDYAINGIS